MIQIVISRKTLMYALFQPSLEEFFMIRNTNNAYHPDMDKFQPSLEEFFMILSHSVENVQMFCSEFQPSLEEFFMIHNDNIANNIHSNKLVEFQPSLEEFFMILRLSENGIRDGVDGFQPSLEEFFMIQ